MKPNNETEQILLAQLAEKRQEAERISTIVGIPMEAKYVIMSTIWYLRKHQPEASEEQIVTHVKGRIEQAKQLLGQNHTTEDLITVLNGFITYLDKVD